MKKITNNILRYALSTAIVIGSFSVYTPQALAWNLQGSCSANASSSNTGDTVVWSATQSSTMTAGQGHYEYVWSGTDSLTGTTQSVSKIYATAGTKNTSVIIKMVLNSGLIEKITRTCSATITTPPPPGECKLELVKSVDKATALPGDILTYTLSFKNIGTSACTGGGVRVEDKYDSNLTYQSETHSQIVDPGYNGVPLHVASTRTLSWDANILQPGMGGTISWTAKVNTPTSCGNFDIPNQAKITSKEYSPTDLLSTPSVWVLSNTVKTTITKECPPPTLIGSCAVSPNAIMTGESAVWSATATGGTGTYTYLWSGSDSLAGTASSVTKSYSATGTKTGTVVITSGTQSVTKNCSLTVTQTPPPPPPALVGSCSGSPSSVNTGQNVTWSSTATGGTGTYTYVWTGDNGLSSTNSSTVSSYSTVGTKNASVVITSGSNSITKNCTVTVTTPPPPPPSDTPLVISCSATPGVAEIGANVTWSSSATGGTGAYTYSWSGTDGLTGTDANLSKNYGTTGTKNGTVTVTSGTESKTSELCSVVVRPPISCTSNCGGGGGGGGIDQPTVVLLKKISTTSPLAFVYLSQIPYTGLSDHYGLLIFFLALIVWSVLVTFVIRSDKTLPMARKLIGMFASMKPRTQNASDVLNEAPFEVKEEDVVDLSIYNRALPNNLPISDSRQAEIIEDDIRDILSQKAKENKVLLSDDAISILLELSGDAEANLGKVVKISEEKIEKEDGWVLINKGRMSTIADIIKESEPEEVSEVPLEVPAQAVSETKYINNVIPTPKEATKMETTPSTLSKPVDSKEFLLWIARGENQKILDFIRKMKEIGVEPSSFIKSVIYNLDQVYRSRIERDIIVVPELAQITAGWNEVQIEEMISILLTIIEHTYKNSTIGIKIAVMRMVDIKQFRS